MQSHMACFLYCSTIAPHTDLAGVASLIKQARSFNAAQQITGLLIFDGQRFCQYIEGPAQAVAMLAERIARDPRHMAFGAQHQGPLKGERLFSRWCMAYALIDDAEPLREMQALHGEGALERLHTLLPALDMA